MIDYPILAYGITHLTDARYFAAWHPDFLCFPLGEGGLSLDYIVAIREWVAGPVCVVELTGGDAGAKHSGKELSERGITHVLLDYGLSVVPFTSQGMNVITRLAVGGYQSAPDVAERLYECTGPVVLDFTDGGITWGDLIDGHPFTAGMLKEMIGDRQVYIRIDLTPDEIVEASQLLYGLAFRGSSEEKVGYKNFGDIDQLLEALED